MVDIIKPILYSATEIEFETAGLGILSDVISCVVIEERNGIFELEMQYPTNGIHFSEISDDCIIYSKPSPFRIPEPFRIYKTSVPLNGIVTINARHLTYDLNGIPVTPFDAANAAGALQGIKSHMATQNPFDFWTNKTTSANFKVEAPTGARSLLGGQSGSILDVYGGEYAWQGTQVRLYDQRGQDRGVNIRYGKNLTDINQERNLSNMTTGIYPYWTNGEGDIVICDPPIIYAEGNFPVQRIATVDFSNDFEEKPTPQQLQQKAESYVSNNQIGVPNVSIKVSFVDLNRSTEYSNLNLIEQCDLCDIVTVQFPAFNIDAKAKIVKIEYDALLDRYNNIEIGSVRANIASTIVDQQTQIQQNPTIGLIQSIANGIVDSITGANGGAVRLLDTNNDGDPDTLYIADNPDPALAQKVWRFNYEGWGASTNGYNGPFSVAATLDQGLYGDFITAGTINASLIKAGVLQSIDGDSFYLDLVSGILKMKAQSFEVEGKTIEETVSDEVEPINQELNNKVDSNHIISAINLSPESIKIAADKVNVTGFVTFSDLSNAGQTTINGANITTGYISGDRISGGTIDGSIINQRDVFDSGITLSHGQISFYYEGTFLGTMNSESSGGSNYIEIFSNYEIGLKTVGVLRLIARDSGYYGVSVDSLESEDDVVVDGNFSCHGAKNCVQSTDTYGDRLLNAYETAEYYLGDIGESEVNNGEVIVTFDPIFAECVNTDATYQVFLTKYGEGNIYVAERNSDHFVVRGDNISFGWEIKAKRRGFENARLEQPLDKSTVKVPEVIPMSSDIDTFEYDPKSIYTEEQQQLRYYRRVAEKLTREERAKPYPDIQKVLQRYGMLNTEGDD